MICLVSQFSMVRSTLVLVLCMATAAVATPAHASSRSEQLTSNVPGIAFDRIFQVWLENVNYDVRLLDSGGTHNKLTDHRTLRRMKT